MEEHRGPRIIIQPNKGPDHLVMVEMERRDELGCILKIESAEFSAWLTIVVKERTRDGYEFPSLGRLETGSVIYKVKENGKKNLFGRL